MAGNLSISDSHVAMTGNLSISDDGTTVSQTRIYRNVNIVLYSGILPVLLLIGMIFNAVAIKVLKRHIKRCPAMVNLFALCIADVFIMMKFGLYVTVMNVRLHVKYPGVEWISCKVLEYYPSLDHAVMCWMVYITVLIAIERTLAIHKPLTVHIIWSKSRAIKAIVGVYVFGILVGLAFLLFSKKNFSDTSEFSRSVRLADIVVMRIIPIATLLICNIMIWQGFRRHAADFALMSKVITTNPAAHKASKIASLVKLTKTLLIVTFMLMICVIPGFIFGIIIWSKRENIDIAIPEPANSTEMTHMVIVFIECIHCCINAMLYILGNRKFRSDLTEMFRWRQLAVLDMSAEDSSAIQPYCNDDKTKSVHIHQLRYFRTMSLLFSPTEEKYVSKKP